VLLLPYQIRFGQPRSEGAVDVAQMDEAKFVQVISRRKRLDSAKARVFETSRKDHVPIQPLFARSDLCKGHPHLKSDPSLLGENSYGANRPNGCDDCVEESPNRWWLTTKVMSEGVAAAGVRLIAIGELASALLTSPQAWPVGHGNPNRCAPNALVSAAPQS